MTTGVLVMAYGTPRDRDDIETYYTDIRRGRPPTPEPWLGPDVLDIVRERADAGAAGLVVSACGFVADHLEVAYDLDIEAAALARELGLPFARTASVNDDASVMTALAELVAQR